MTDLIFEFKRKGEPSGFNSSTEQEFIFKPDKYSAMIIPLEILKKNLRVMVKQGVAKIVKAGDVEAVVVPAAKFKELFI